jgi:hypothetical protein
MTEGVIRDNALLILQCDQLCCCVCNKQKTGRVKVESGKNVHVHVYVHTNTHTHTFIPTHTYTYTHNVCTCIYAVHKTQRRLKLPFHKFAIRDRHPETYGADVAHLR